jgi:hypothetical protein
MIWLRLVIPALGVPFSRSFLREREAAEAERSGVDAKSEDRWRAGLLGLATSLPAG